MNDTTRLVAHWDVMRGPDGRVRPVMRWVTRAAQLPAAERVAVPVAA